MTLYRNKEHGGYVEVEDDQADPISFYPQGGGFGHKGPRAKFMEMFERAEMPATHHKARFTMDLWDHDVEGYSNGARWNGWAMPEFTFEVAQSVAADWPDMRYDAERDAFVYSPPEYPGEEDVYRGRLIHTTDGELKLYAVGSGFWCWDEVDEADAKKADD